MTRSFRSRSRGWAAAASTLLALGACDDPAEMAKEVVEARGDCSQDSLRVSSETCVRMFERYAGMATEAIHAYIGGVKAMDQALKRLPPPNFDTAGLGHAFTPGAAPPDSLDRSPELPERVRLYARDHDAYPPDPLDDPAPRWDEPYGRYEPDGYEPDGDPQPRGYEPDGYEPDPRRLTPGLRPPPAYDDPRRDAPRPRPEAQPAPRPGVLLPPRARLGRPWLGEGEARAEPRAPTEREEWEQREEREERPRR